MADYVPSKFNRFSEIGLPEGYVESGATGPTTDFGENYDAAFNVALTQTSIAADTALTQKYNDHRKKVLEATGVYIPNPKYRPAQRKADGTTVTQLDREYDYMRQIETLAKQNPEKMVPLISPELVRQEIANERKALRDKQADIEGRARGFWSGTGSIAGNAVGMFNDPILLGSMAFGAPFAAGVLRTGLIEAGIGLVSEVPVQGIVQAQRTQFGERPDLGEAVGNVLMAGAGGFVLGAGIRGASRLAGRALAGPMRRLLATAERNFERLPPSAQNAFKFLKRQEEMEAQNPFPDTVEGQGAHIQNYDEAVERITGGRIESEDPELDPTPPERVEAEAVIPRSNTVDTDPIASEALAEASVEATGDDNFVTLVKGLADDIVEGTETVEAVGRLRAVLGDALRDIKTLKARLAEPKAKKPLTLIDFLVAEKLFNGRKVRGLKPSAELDAIGINAQSRPGLINKDGMTLDEASMLADEAGYLGELTGRKAEDVDIGDGRSGQNTLIDAIRDDFEGRSVYKADDADLLQIWQDHLDLVAETDRALNMLGLNRDAPELIIKAMRYLEKRVDAEIQIRSQAEGFSLDTPPLGERRDVRVVERDGKFIATEGDRVLAVDEDGRLFWGGPDDNPALFDSPYNATEAAGSPDVFDPVARPAEAPVEQAAPVETVSEVPERIDLGDFRERANRGEIKQAKTDIEAIEAVKSGEQPATEIEIKFGGELSDRYELGELTEELEKTGLYVEDNNMGNLFIGKNKEAVEKLKNAETPLEYGLAYGYSLDDISAFYKNRRGGNVEIGFEEFLEDLHISNKSNILQKTDEVPERAAPEADVQRVVDEGDVEARTAEDLDALQRELDAIDPTISEGLRRFQEIQREQMARMDGTEKFMLEAKAAFDQIRMESDDPNADLLYDSVVESTQDFQDAMVLTVPDGGQGREVTVRELLQEIDNDEKLMAEVLDCAGVKS